MKRIAIMGAGAVGSTIGAFLTRGGHAPVLIDPWWEHVNAMKERGLRMSGTRGEFTVYPQAVHLNGLVVEEGSRVGVPTPVNAAVVEALKEVELGRRPLDPANVGRVVERVGLAVRG